MMILISVLMLVITSYMYGQEKNKRLAEMYLSVARFSRTAVFASVLFNLLANTIFKSIAFNGKMMEMLSTMPF